MRKITYSGDSFLTADAAADALIAFAAVLGNVNASETVAIPVLDGEGTLDEVLLLMGPTSELIIMPTDSPYADPDVSKIVEHIRRRTVEIEAASGPIVAKPVEAPSLTVDLGDEI